LEKFGEIERVKIIEKMDVYDSYSKKLLAEDILPFELEDAAVDAKEETAILPSTGVKQIRRIFGGDTGPTNNNNNNNNNTANNSGGNTGSGPNSSPATTTNNNNSSNENTSTSHNNSSRSASNRSNRSKPETSKKQGKEEEQEEAEPELVQNVSEFDAVRFLESNVLVFIGCQESPEFLSFFVSHAH
jgi:hypothetical protein